MLKRIIVDCKRIASTIHGDSCWRYRVIDPSGSVNPVNSCIFVALLYFPVFHLCPVFPVFEDLADNGLITVPINKLIALSSDGPNVNAAITNLVNKELTDSHLPMMVDIGSSSLHKVHNAFAKGLATFYRAMLCIRGTSHGPVSVCPSVRPSQAGVLLKRQNIGSHKQHHTIPQGF